MSASFPQNGMSLPGQLAELRREQSMRSTVFPGLVSSGRLRQTDAAHRQIALAQAIKTLERLITAPDEMTLGELRRELLR